MALDSNFERRISGLEEVEQLLGPDLNFSNATVVSVNLLSSIPSMELVILARYIKQYTETYLFSFVFEDIDDLILEAFNHQNIMIGLDFYDAGERVGVKILSKFGVEMSFTYRDGKVTTQRQE